MSDQVLNILIIAAAGVLVVIIILFFLRDKISKINFVSDLFKTNIETHDKKPIKITKTKQTGNGNKINVERGDVDISEFEQDGNNQELKIQKP